MLTWLSVVVTTVEADLVATGEAEAEVVGVVPFKGFVAVRVASLTSWNFSMNCAKRKGFSSFYTIFWRPFFTLFNSASELKPRP